MAVTTRKWLECLLSLKYISNTCIYAALISYYTQAYWIFLALIPLLISNALVMLVLEWFSGDELTRAVLGSGDEQTKFIFLNTVWHVLPLMWVYYVLQHDNLINIFRPNFMGIFLAGALFAIGYFYFASNGKYYGEIDYSQYMVVYMITLLGSCIGLYG